MATKRQKKKAAKVAKKVAKKYLIIIVILLLIVIGLAIGGFILYKNGYFDKWLNKNEEQNNTPLTVNGEVQIYSIEMHDEYGDSLFIKYKDYDVLIDSGNYGDAEYVRNFVDANISSDKNLDVLIQ